MYEISVVIPNYNGEKFLPACLGSLGKQTGVSFEVIIVDNHSTDRSLDLVAELMPEAKIITLDKNYGFPRAVNEGMKAADAPFVILLNNDTEADAQFVGNMLKAIKSHPDYFSIEAKMIQFYDRDKIDSAGSLYCAFGWALACGKGKSVQEYTAFREVFAACAGAAVYRKNALKTVGCFDEEHFVYLEDIDICYRARIFGYKNGYAPDAVVYHVGSGTSGSRYNEFKVRYSARNNIYMIYKNMPWFQILLNILFLSAGFAVKFIFFLRKGLGKEYLTGLRDGFSLAHKNKAHKVKYHPSHLKNYIRIQLDLWRNMINYFR